MNPKTIFIHIGPQKTGTTTIQVGLKASRKRLKAAGFLVPITGQTAGRSAAQHHLGWELVGSKHFDARQSWAALRKEIDQFNGSSVILSTETLSQLEANQIEIIRNHLVPHDVRIVMYLRRQDGLLQSLWTQRIKNPRMRLPEALEEFIVKKENHAHISAYALILQRWESVFDKENMLVRVLETNQLRGQLFQDFLFTCGVEHSDRYPNPQDANVTPGAQTLELMAYFKSRLFQKLNHQGMTCLFDTIQHVSRANHWKDVPVNLINRSLYARIMAEFDAMNLVIARRCFGRERLFLEEYEEKIIRGVNPEDVCREDVALVLDAYPFHLLNGIRDVMLKKEEDMNPEDLELLKIEIKRILQSPVWKWLSLRQRIRSRLL